MFASCSTPKKVTPEGAIIPPPVPVSVSRSDVRAELSQDAAINGSLVILNVTLPQKMDPKDISVQFDGSDIPLFAAPERGAGAYSAWIGLPFQIEPGEREVLLSWKEGKLALPLKVLDGNYPTESLHVDPRRVNPKKKDLLRMRREGALVQKLYNDVITRRMWTSFQLPIPSKVTSIFGTKRLFNGEMQSFHQGIDLKAPEGTPIHATSGGKVVLAKNLFMTGNTVLINHGYGVFTIYAHMSKTKVHRGQIVKAGQLLGLSGHTGRANGPHLHWGLVVNHAKLNPLELIRISAPVRKLGTAP